MLINSNEMYTKKIIYTILILGFLSASCNSTTVNKVDESITPQPSTLIPSSNPQLASPISNPLSRVTKKPFAIYITKQNSPVQPEKFSGYHTGTDFEILDGEQDQEVEILVTCNGKLLQKKYATGYGGVVVQSCKLDGADVTIIYGHLQLASIAAKVGDELTQNTKLGILGKGYTTETDGERKHLHFGVHKGTGLNILGYVQKASQTSDWLNALDYIK